jgi:hypothetical protein
MQRAQDGRFGEFAAEVFLNLGCRHHAALFEQLPNLCDERRDPVRASRPRRMFPIAVAAQRIHEGQRLKAHEKVGMIGGAAEQVQRQRGVGLDEANQQPFRCLDRRAGWSGIGLAEAGLDEGWSGGGNLRLAGKKQAEARVLKPCLRVVQSQQRLGLLPPERRACRQ